jgi:hypothetical protein
MLLTQRSALGEPGSACDAWDRWGFRVASDHGDPYVFPAAVAELQELAIAVVR